MDDFLKSNYAWTTYFEQQIAQRKALSRSLISFNNAISLADWLPENRSKLLVDESLARMSDEKRLATLQSLVGLQKAYEDSYNSLTRDIKNSLFRYARFNSLLANAQDNSDRIMRMFHPDYERVLSVLIRPFEWDMPEYIRETREERLADFLLEEKLHFLLDITDDAIEGFTRELLETSQVSSTAAVTKHLHKITSEVDFLNDLYRSFSSVPVIRTRKPVIEAALEAHAKREYLLSIPALLPQVEALTMRLLADARYVRWDKRKPGWYETLPESGEYRLNKNDNRIMVLGLGSLHGVLSRMQESPLPNSLPFLKDEVSRFRNNVLHGNLAKYGKSRESSRLVLLLMTLGRVLETSQENRQG